MPAEKKGIHIPIRKLIADVMPQPAAPPEETTDWQALATRLYADMDSFRKRQTLLAEERILTEKEALLRKFLDVADNLRGVLARLDPTDPVHQGIRVTGDALEALLHTENVELIPDHAVPFNPQWHEAVAQVPAVAGQTEELWVIEAERPGYRIGERLLRPARVIVAKRE